MNRTCYKCGEIKPLSEFHRDESRPGGYAYVCKICRRTHRHAYYERQKARLRAEYDPEVERNKRLLVKYGITAEDYDGMYKEQDGKCKICQEPFELLHVDHCHATMRVRGLLCGLCNTSLGGFRDDPIRLQRAIEYLGENQ